MEKQTHPRCVLWRLSAAPASWRGAWAVSGALSGDGLAPITAGRDNATPHRTALWLAAWGVQVRSEGQGSPRARVAPGEQRRKLERSSGKEGEPTGPPSVPGAVPAQV